MGSQYTEVPSPGVVAFICFATQVNRARFVSAVATTLHIPTLFGFNPGGATGMGV